MTIDDLEERMAASADRSCLTAFRMECWAGRGSFMTFPLADLLLPVHMAGAILGPVLPGAAPLGQTLPMGRKNLDLGSFVHADALWLRATGPQP